MTKLRSLHPGGKSRRILQIDSRTSLPRHAADSKSATKRALRNIFYKGLSSPPTKATAASRSAPASTQQKRYFNDLSRLVHEAYLRLSKPTRTIHRIIHSGPTPLCNCIGESLAPLSQHSPSSRMVTESSQPIQEPDWETKEQQNPEQGNAPFIIVTTPEGFRISANKMPEWRRVHTSFAARQRQREWQLKGHLSPLHNTKRPGRSGVSRPRKKLPY